MPDYKKLYFQLFAALADATEALEDGDFRQAKDILIAAQQRAEEAYVDAE